MAPSGHPARPLAFDGFQPRIGELLLARGLISQAQLADALARKHPGERLGEALVRLELVYETDLVRTLASQCGLEFIDLTTHGADVGCAQLLPQTLARELDAIPVRSTADGTIVVAVADPLEVDEAALVRALDAPVQLRVAELSAIRRLLAAAWPRGLQERPAAPAESARRWRFRVGDPTRATALRDYFLRLGAEATLDGPDVVAVGALAYPSQAGELADLERYAAAWAGPNGTSAQLVD